MSLFSVIGVITPSVLEFAIESKFAAPSAKVKVPPSAFNSILPAESNAKLPSESANDVPSKVRLSTVTPPSASTEANVTAAPDVKS